MREILFRGKRIDNGEWIEGNYCAAEYITSDGIEHLIIEVPRNGCSAKINPSTIGQFTGMCDKNGERIFEGDICHVGHLLYKVEFRYSQWIFTILSNKVYCYPAFNSHCGERCIIIGNIHDNPELLEDNG